MFLNNLVRVQVLPCSAKQKCSAAQPKTTIHSPFTLPPQSPALVSFKLNIPIFCYQHSKTIFTCSAHHPYCCPLELLQFVNISFKTKKKKKKNTAFMVQPAHPTAELLPNFVTGKIVLLVQHYMSPISLLLGIPPSMLLKEMIENFSGIRTSVFSMTNVFNQTDRKPLSLSTHSS